MIITLLIFTIVIYKINQSRKREKFQKIMIMFESQYKLNLLNYAILLDRMNEQLRKACEENEEILEEMNFVDTNIIIKLIDCLDIFCDLYKTDKNYFNMCTNFYICSIESDTLPFDTCDYEGFEKHLMDYIEVHRQEAIEYLRKR